MSLFRSGTTMEIVGSVLGSAGKLVNGMFALPGTLEKFTQGLCFRTYAPDAHPV